MKSLWFSRVVVYGLLLAPLGFAATPKKRPAMSSDMQRAIAFERYKDMAAARQARLEARHPSVTYSNSANREGNTVEGNTVKDEGPTKKK